MTSITVNIIATLVRLVAVLLIFIKVFPKQYKESKIGNGIGFLRKLIFAVVITYITTDLVLIISGIVYILTFSPVIFNAQFVLFDAFGDLLIAILLYLIYNERILTLEER